MKISVFGTGYVGLVTGVCLADTGNHVVCCDIKEEKVDALRRGECPIFEPGLAGLLRQNQEAGRVTFTTDDRAAVTHGDVLFIAVGTPPLSDGSADPAQVDAVAAAIAKHADRAKIVVTKSTVPVGTGARLEKYFAEQAKHRITVVSNPEFLKEGSAVDDFLRPDRVVIGTDDPEALEVLSELYDPFVRKTRSIVPVARAAAEMIKYAANCYLAMRISFINQIAQLCARVGVDIDEVRKGIGPDERIGFHFLYPGIGYGGSCFPKDVPALCHLGGRHGVRMSILHDVHEVNQRQPELLLDDARRHFGGLRGRTFAVWGAAFKPRTDDIREAPALRVIDGLLADGARVRVYDPQATANLRAHYGQRVTHAPDAYAALEGADALIICTEWQEFRSPDFDRLRAALKQPVIFDGRNVFTLRQMRRRGFVYYSIGRPPITSPEGGSAGSR